MEGGSTGCAAELSGGRSAASTVETEPSPPANADKKRKKATISGRSVEKREEKRREESEETKEQSRRSGAKKEV